MNTGLISLIILIVNVFLISSSNTFVLPFLPVYLENELNCSAERITIYTASCYSVTYIVSIIFSPIWGKFADKFGRKKMLIRVSLLLCISYLFSYMSTSALQLCLSRAFQGLASGMMPAIITFTANISEDDHKTSLFIGIIQSTNLLGTIIGSSIGGFFSEIYGVRNSFLTVFLLTLTVTFTNLLLLKENKKEISSDNQDNRNSLRSVRQILRDPVMQSLCSCVFVHAAVIMMIVPILANHVTNISSFDEPIALSGLVFSLSGIAGVIASPLWSKYGSHHGFLKVMMISSFFASIIYMIQAHITDIYIFCVLQFLFGLCICATIPAANSIVAKRIEEKNQTKAFSILYSSTQAGNFFGPIISAMALYFASEAAVFSICSLILIFIFTHLFITNKLRKNFK